MKASHVSHQTLDMPITWDTEAREGKRPQAVLDHLQEAHPKARFKATHTGKEAIELPKLRKGGRALLIVNTTDGGIRTDKHHAKAVKGTLVVLGKEPGVIEGVARGERMILEYSL